MSKAAKTCTKQNAEALFTVHLLRNAVYQVAPAKTGCSARNDETKGLQGGSAANNNLLCFHMDKKHTLKHTLWLI